MFAVRKSKGEDAMDIVRKLSWAAAAALLACFATPVHAQAARTWVSGVGDDVNPCSRTAPCKTFAGAISKTAGGGEINCLDAGGFGAVTINKSLTIDCHFTEGGALASGNGIVVNATASDVVVIRGLDIFGVSPSTHGIRILAAAAVHIEDCVIRRFNSSSSFGISFQPSATTTLHVLNTSITDNGLAGIGGGINVQPTGGTGSAKVVLRRVNVKQNSGAGLNINANTASSAGVQVAVDDSQFAGNATGISAAATGIVATTFLTGSTVAQNSGTGLSVSGNASTMVVSNTTVTGNGTGLAESGGAIISSYGDNRVEANPNFLSPNNGVFNGTQTKK
jgi:hypothetical protein